MYPDLYCCNRRNGLAAELMPANSLYGKVNDSVFIMYHRKTDGYPLMVKPELWQAVQNNGETATGVVVMSGDKIRVIAPSEATELLKWSRAKVVGGGTAINDIETAICDWDGKNNTASQATHSECSSAGYAPGFCNLYSHGGHTEGKWWLPSLGEMMMIYANLSKINYALSLIEGATPIPKGWHWSSTEWTGDGGSWLLGTGDGYMNYGDKVKDAAHVRPVSTFML